jgi:hypothetical protein
MNTYPWTVDEEGRRGRRREKIIVARRTRSSNGSRGSRMVASQRSAQQPRTNLGHSSLLFGKSEMDKGAS